MKSRVTERGQVTIPKRLRQRLGIRPGEVLDFTEGPDGSVVARKAAAGDPVDAAYGVLDLPEGTDALIADLRGEPDSL